MKKDYEKDLVQEVARLENMGENCPSPEAVQKYIKVKNELNKISYDRARGACVRSKARWHEFGERSSKYFLNLERRNYKQLLDEVFVISRIIKVEVRVISRSRRLRLITLTETLIILDITKTESNNCFIIH